jgi:hypothetical protein
MGRVVFVSENPAVNQTIQIGATEKPFNGTEPIPEKNEGSLSSFRYKDFVPVFCQPLRQALAERSISIDDQYAGEGLALRFFGTDDIVD